MASSGDLCEFERRIAPTCIAPVEKREQRSCFAAHHVHLVNVVVQEAAGGRRANGWSECCDPALDVRCRGRVDVSGRRESGDTLGQIQRPIRPIEPAIGIGACVHVLMQPGQLPPNSDPHLPVASGTARKQPQRLAVDALPNRIRPVHEHTRVVEGEQARRQHAGLASDRRGDRFGARILHRFGIIGGDAQHDAGGRIDPIGDPRRSQRLPGLAYPVTGEDLSNRIRVAQRADLEAVMVMTVWPFRRTLA